MFLNDPRLNDGDGAAVSIDASRLAVSGTMLATLFSSATVAGIAAAAQAMSAGQDFGEPVIGMF